MNQIINTKSFYFLFLLILFSSQIIYAQNKLLTKEEIDNQYEKLDESSSNGDENIKKNESLIVSSEKINYKNGIITGKMRLLNILNSRSDYKKMLKIIDELEASDIQNNEQISTIYIYKYYINKALGIEKVQYQNLQDAVKFAKLIDNHDKKHLRTATAYNLFAMYYDQKNPDSLFYFLKKQLEELEKISDNNPKLRTEKYNLIALNNINIGNFYLGVAQPQRLDLAEPYYLKVYNYRITKPDIFKSNDMAILCGVGRFYMVKGEYKKSIEIANEILQLEKRKKNTTYRQFAYMLLEDSYEGLNNPVEQIKYTTLLMELNDSLNKAAKKEVSKQFDRLVTDVEVKKEKEYTSNIKMLLASIGCLVLILLLTIWFYWYKKSKNTHKKYEAIISKIKSESQISENNQEINKNEESKTIITEDTAKLLLRKLEKFEKSQLYLQPDVSMVWLANYFKTNTKYLSEVLKIYKEKSFSSYINGLRINYIIKKLVEDPIYREYKIEYLAEECGYASRQVFLNTFKKETGLTPTEFIKKVKNTNIQENSYT